MLRPRRRTTPGEAPQALAPADTAPAREAMTVRVPEPRTDGASPAAHGDAPAL